MPGLQERALDVDKKPRIPRVLRVLGHLIKNFMWKICKPYVNIYYWKGMT